MIHRIIVSAAEDVVSQLLTEAGHRRPDGLRLLPQHPSNPGHGDYSLNTAMLLASVLKRNPLSIACEIRDRLLARPAIQNLFLKVESAPPGFINFYVDWEKWAAAPLPADSTSADRRQKVVIEHTSINPNKSAHIGHLRNSCIGDTLARMLKKAGFRVEIHNYIDDLGNQLADTVVGLLHTPSQDRHRRFGDFCWDTYSGINKAYQDDPALQDERARVLHAMEEGGSSLAWIGSLTAERIVREHLEEMKAFRIGYDVLVWESSIVREGLWSEAFKRLQATPLFVQETEGKLAGCWVLKSSGEPMEETAAEFQSDKVLVRSNGILTYTAKDIAYHLWKFGLLGKDFVYIPFTGGIWSTGAHGMKKRFGHADIVINVIDHRQEYPQAMVKQALLALGFEEQAHQLRHVSYGVVSLSRNTASRLGVDTSDRRTSYPMSGRQGIGVKAADLLDRMEAIVASKRSRRTGLSSRTIAAAAVRYYLLRFHLQTEVIFDFEQATEISGNTGIYLMYAYARACSVLAKGGEEVRSPGSFRSDRLEPQEVLLMRQLAYWPEAWDTALQELAPNQICAYAHELASLFNHFYATCPIHKADAPEKTFRLWLTGRFRETLGEALSLLGLPAPGSM